MYLGNGSRILIKLQLTIFLTMSILCFPFFIDTSMAATKVAAPKGLSAKGVTKSQINLKWNRVSGANEYKIYRATSKNGKYSYVGTTSSNKFSIKGLKTGTTYWYKVSAVKKAVEGAKSTKISDKTLASSNVARPSSIRSLRSTENQIHLVWMDAKGAKAYNIFRAKGQTGSYAYVGTTKLNNYIDKDLQASTTYRYKVSSVNIKGEGKQSAAVSINTMVKEEPDELLFKTNSDGWLDVYTSYSPDTYSEYDGFTLDLEIYIKDNQINIYRKDHKTISHNPLYTYITVMSQKDGRILYRYIPEVPYPQY